MKTLLAVAAGLAFGAWVAACSCPAGHGYPTIEAGRYVPADVAIGLEPDYHLDIAADGKTVTETYTESGKSHQLVYTITGSRQDELGPNFYP